MHIIPTNQLLSEHDPRFCAPAACFAETPDLAEHRSETVTVEDGDHVIRVAVARQDERHPRTRAVEHGQTLIRLHIADVPGGAPADESGWYEPHPVHGPVAQLAPHLTPEAAMDLAIALVRAVVAVDQDATRGGAA